MKAGNIFGDLSKIIAEQADGKQNGEHRFRRSPGL
jgi:hypothetical protein